MSFRPVRLALVLLPLCFAACRDAKVTAYRVPKEKDPVLPLAGAAGAGETMANTAVPTATGPGLAWTAPAHWISKPATAMRKATYTVPGAAGVEGDLSITAFAGETGGELANVNRWLGQVQLPPLAESELAKVVTRLEANGLHIAYVDFGGGKGGDSLRMLGAIVPFGSGTWFFKLSGPDALIAREKPAFEAFIKTLKPAVEP